MRPYLQIFFFFAAVFLLALASCKQQPAGPPTTTSSSDTIAWYPHPLIDGKDATGHGHNGTFGAVSPIQVSGEDRFRQGQLRGNLLKITNTDGLNFTGDDSYTISAWVQLFDNGSGIIAAKTAMLDSNLHAAVGYQLLASQGEIIVLINDSLSSQEDTRAETIDLLRSDTATGPGHWHLVTLSVQARKSVSLYLDSELLGTNTDAAATMTPNIGNNGTPLILGDPSMLIDNVVILNKTATPDWVAARFHEGGWYEHSDSVTDSLPSDTSSAFHWSQPEPMPSGILGMTWTSNSTGFACGKQGAIWKTTDSGVTWQNVNQTATQSDLYSIDFIEKWGIAVGFSKGPAIIYTTDGGDTWSSGPVPAGVATITDVIYRATPGTFGFAVGSDSSGHGVILYSDYGGEYWVIDKTTPKPLYAISMNNDYLGQYNPIIAVGDAGQEFVSTAWKSDTGGRIYTGLTWTDHSAGNENFRAITPVTNRPYEQNQGVVLTDDGATLWTTDGGITWVRHSENVSTYQPQASIYQVGGSEAWISGSNIAHTTDGGVTWKNDNPVAGQTWTCISARDAHHIAFLTQSGQLYWLTR